MAEMLAREDLLYYPFGEFQDKWIISSPSVRGELRPLSFLNGYRPVFIYR